MCSAKGQGASKLPEYEWPEESRTASRLRRFYQSWTYSYMNPVLDKGKKQTFQDGTHLSDQDIYRVPHGITALELSSLFAQYYQEEKDREHRLMWTLWRLAKPTFVPAGFCQLVTVVAQVAVPLLVRSLLNILEDHPGERVLREGMPFAILIFVSLVFNSFANNRHRHLAMQSGIVMRAALINAIYEHILHLTPQGRTGLTVGEVNNLAAVDTQKIFEVTQDANLLWSMPLSIVLVTGLLVYIMGPTTLVGVGVLILFVPIVERIASRMLKIRHERVKLSDKRVGIINSMLQGIQTTKLNNYEAKYQERVEQARSGEVAMLQKELAYWGVTLVVTVASPVVATAATFITYALASEQNILTSAESFTVLLLFIALRFPINYAGRLIGRAAQAWESLRRIEAFLKRDVRSASASPQQLGGDQQLASTVPQHDNESRSPMDSTVLAIENATFRIGPAYIDSFDGVHSSREGLGGFSVSGLDVTVRKGEVLAVCGPVGCGKSTLINGIIDEVPALEGSKVSMKGRISYASQTPFILSATLRDNVLFGLRYEPAWYDRVVEACCLKPDFEQLGRARDLTEIGERGVTLSGGQKQRVSLARAVYARPSLVLMDDPLSALDAGTAKTIFERLFKSSSRRPVLANAGVVLVTHASHFLNQVDRILVLCDGEKGFLGTWEDLLHFKTNRKKAMDAIEFIRSSVQEGRKKTEDDDTTNKNVEESTGDSNGRRKAREEDGKLMTEEEREHGLSSWKTWLLWFKYAGGIRFMTLQVLLMTADRVAYVAVEYWIARWTEGADQAIDVFGIHFDPQTSGRSAQYKYIGVYVAIMSVSIFATFLRSEWVVTGGSRCSRTIFLAMLSSVLASPMSFFETTPMGRILNRFTYDTEVVDLTLSESMSVLMIASSWLVASVIIMVTIMPWIALVLVPVVVIYSLLLLHYRRSGTDLQRIDAMARSPVQSMLSEGLDGTAIIRVLCQESFFLDKFRAAADASSGALLNYVTAQRWIGVRIELLGSVVVLSSCLFVISLNHVIILGPGIVGLLIVWSSNFTISLGFLVDHFAEAEAAITSIERVDAMSRLPRERAMITPGSSQLPRSWPEHGDLEFESVCMRYRGGLPLALNKLSFRIPAGKRCGVVGRTGAGKSSLAVALFRIVEVESGRIYLDGVNLADIGLNDVRGRPGGMAIIPQDPFLTGTSVRECLDPFGNHEDSDILEALIAVRLAESSSGFGVLDTGVEEGGANYSVGERQLLNLARALLQKPKLLVLDEATASIDGETDSFIQSMLRTRFADTTLLTVAHRLNTIMDYDLVLVMDSGFAAEFGSPGALLERKGMFSALVDATGVESARALREMAST